MKHQIATDPSQAKRLLACGVDPNTADMYLSINMCPGVNYGKYSTRILGEDLLTLPEILRSIDYSPAWSLSALLALLPKHLKNKSGYNAHSFVIEYAHTASPSQWRIAYDGWYNGAVSFCHESPIEACVEAIEWLTANGYTLNTK